MSDLSELLKAPDASVEAKNDFFAINERCMQYNRVSTADTTRLAPAPTAMPHINDHESISGVGVLTTIAGAGRHSALIPTFGATLAVTLALKRRDGTYARSMQDMRRT